jgi:hypothetical protein
MDKYIAKIHHGSLKSNLWHWGARSSSLTSHADDDKDCNRGYSHSENRREGFPVLYLPFFHLFFRVMAGVTSCITLVAFLFSI